MDNLDKIIKESIDKVISERLDEGKNIDEGIGNWIKGAAIGGMMAFSPSANAQSQNYSNNTDSVKTATQQPQQITVKQLKKMFPQAYKDRNASPEVWKQNQNMYVAEVNGKISLVGKIAASSGQNPWNALVKRYCPSEDKTFSLSDFDI